MEQNTLLQEDQALHEWIHINILIRINLNIYIYIWISMHGLIGVSWTNFIWIFPFFPVSVVSAVFSGAWKYEDGEHWRPGLEAGAKAGAGA